MHRQSQKTVGSTKTRYVYSGWKRIADYNGGTGALQRRYVYGTGLDEPLIIVTGTTPTFLHHDKVGSIVAVSNNSGAVANKNKFSPFGEITTLGGTTVGFTGQRYDSELGLYYFKHRYYSPKLGRFLQPDPIGYTSIPEVDCICCDEDEDRDCTPKELNLYTYVRNNPLKYTDPMGLKPPKAPEKTPVIKPPPTGKLPPPKPGTPRPKCGPGGCTTDLSSTNADLEQKVRQRDDETRNHQRPAPNSPPL